MRYAGFWRRLGAHLIDSILLNLVAWLGEYLLLGGMYLVYLGISRHQGIATKSFDDAFDPFLEQILSAIVYVALAGAYFIIAHYRYGTTLGKRPFKIYVVSEADGASLNLRQSVLRFFGYLVSYLPMGCGFLMVAFNPQKRALHDLIAGTVSVIKEG